MTGLEAATRAKTFAPQSLAFLFVTVLLSWAFIHTCSRCITRTSSIRCSASREGRARLPHDPEATYWVFVYFAFAIGTSAEVSDVQVTSKKSAGQFGDTASSLSFSMSR